MKKLGFVILSVACFLSAAAQSPIDDLINAGIVLHDAGQYGQAAEKYRLALTMDPKSLTANYELAMTLSAMKEYPEAIKYCDNAIKIRKDYALAYNVKGSCLDYLGRYDDAIKTFQKGIGYAPDKYLLRFNLGYAYYLKQDYASATDAYITALKLNPSHASSHLQLAHAQAAMGRRVESLLALYFFLLIEPNSGRSPQAYDMLTGQLNRGVSADSTQKNRVNVALSLPDPNDVFAMADLTVTLKGALRLQDQYKDKTQMELLVEVTRSLFGILGEGSGGKDFWHIFYLPVFSSLQEEDLVEVFCYYISLSRDEQAATWLKEHKEVTDRLGEWFDGQAL